jgi:NAD(P)-dependent dehydrogenase (short-subunit alcohol dehydrogenase family)
MKLKDKVAIVTGAGRNIGEETAKLFVAEGAKVAVADFDEGRGRRVADSIVRAGGEALFVKVDVADEESVEAMVTAVADRFGRIDVLVNNVAVSDNKGIRELTLEEWNRTIAITLTSQFLCSKYVAERMIDQGDGGAIRQYRLDFGFSGSEQGAGLCRRQGRGREPDARHGSAARPLQDSRQLGGAQQHRLAGGPG